jgi:hypothetical protein
VGSARSFATVFAVNGIPRSTSTSISAGQPPRHVHASSRVLGVYRNPDFLDLTDQGLRSSSGTLAKFTAIALGESRCCAPDRDAPARLFGSCPRRAAFAMGSDTICLLLQRDAHALGVGQRRAATMILGDGQVCLPGKGEWYMLLNQTAQAAMGRAEVPHFQRQRTCRRQASTLKLNNKNTCQTPHSPWGAGGHE